jgi:hypothetical protein
MQYLLTATRGTAQVTEIIHAQSKEEAVRLCIGPLMRLAFKSDQPEHAAGFITLMDESGFIVYQAEEEM